MILSACLIVKNEEKYLDECLFSIKGHVDEIVIVDTGSTDKSLEIARQHGARLFSLPWTDDFSAARNEALEQAKGEWILSIDADELLHPLPTAHLRKLIENKDIIAYFTLLRPAVGWTEMKTLRLFRKHPWVFYRGVIHERILAGIQRRIAAGDGEIGDSGIIFDHRGFDGDQTAKHRRNIPLLLKGIREEPENLWLRHHLANIYRELGRADEAEKLWTENINLLKNKGKRGPYDCMAHIGLARMELREGRDARPLLVEALGLFPENPQLYWLYGSALMIARCFREAIPYFDRLIQWGMAQDYDRFIPYEDRIFNDYAYEALAECHFRIGDYESSRRYFDKVRKFNPDTMEYDVKAKLCAVLEKTRRHRPETG